MARFVVPACLFAAIVGCRAILPNSSVTDAPQPEALDATQSNAIRPAAHFEPDSKIPAKTVSRPGPNAEAAKNLSDPEPIVLALDCLDRGDDRQAVTHLRRHVALHPDQVLFRAQLAELLARTDQSAEAQAEFERVVAYTQEMPANARERLIHYHTRIMEIAREREDGFAENLHRGIGLYLVACKLAAKGETKDVERLKFKAAGALKDAQAARPDDARAAWYLHRVWASLDQPRPAGKALRRAADSAAFSQLTSAEARELSLAARPAAILK